MSHFSAQILRRFVGLNLLLHSSFPGCSKLPDTWLGIISKVELPVPHLDQIPVSCVNEGFINLGSDVITCNVHVYGDLEFVEQPHCVDGENVTY